MLALMLITVTCDTVINFFLLSFSLFPPVFLSCWQMFSSKVSSLPLACFSVNCALLGKSITCVQGVMGLSILLWTCHRDFRRDIPWGGWPRVAWRASAFQSLCCPASAPPSGPCLGVEQGLDSWGRDSGDGFMAGHLSEGRAVVGLWDWWGAGVSGGDRVEAPVSRSSCIKTSCWLARSPHATSTWGLLCQAELSGRYGQDHGWPVTCALQPRGTSQSLQLGRWLRATWQGCAVSYIFFQSSL